MFYCHNCYHNYYYLIALNTSFIQSIKFIICAVSIKTCMHDGLMLFMDYMHLKYKFKIIFFYMFNNLLV